MVLARWWPWTWIKMSWSCNVNSVLPADGWALLVIPLGTLNSPQFQYLFCKYRWSPTFLWFQSRFQELSWLEEGYRRRLHVFLHMCLKFYSVLDSARTDQHFFFFFLTLVDLFLLLLWPVPVHRLIYFTFKTSGLSDAEAARLFLFKLLLLPLVPVLAASPNGPDESGLASSGDSQCLGFLLISFSMNVHRQDRITEM